MLMVFLKVTHGVLIKKGQDKDIAQVIVLPDVLSAPVSDYQVLGSVSYNLIGNEVCKVNIVCDSSVEKISGFNMIESVYSKWFSLLRQ